MKKYFIPIAILAASLLMSGCAWTQKCFSTGEQCPQVNMSNVSTGAQPLSPPQSGGITIR